jgi:hypothetical protein
MPQGARDLGKLLLDQVNVGSVEEKKAEELEFLEEAKHDDDDKDVFIEPVVPEVSTIVDPAPKKPEVKEEDPGIGIFAPGDPRKIQFEKEMKAEEEDIADLKSALDGTLTSLRNTVIAFRQSQGSLKPGEKMAKGRESHLKKMFRADKSDLYQDIAEADEKTTMPDTKIMKYRQEIGKADTPSKLKLIADILNQELEKMYPKIKPSKTQKQKERETRAHGNIRVLP